MRIRDDHAKSDARADDRTSTAPVPHGPASSNPVLELQAALRRARERERGRERALRELGKRADNPEWRRHDHDAETEEVDDANGMMTMPPLEVKAAAPEAAQRARARPAPTLADERPETDAGPATHTLHRPPTSLVGLHPPNDRLLQRPPAPERADAHHEPGGESAVADAEPAPADARDGAASAGRPALAQHQPLVKQPHGKTAAPRPTHDVKAPKSGVLPRPGLNTTDQKKVADQAKHADKGLADGPKLPKAKGEVKPVKGKPATTGLPEVKKAATQAKPTASSGGGGEVGGDAEAWGQRHAKKADKLEAKQVPDAERYVATYTAARATASGNADKEHLELLDSAAKAVDPLPMPKDAPAYPQPDNFAEAHALVTGKLNREIPDQSLPDLTPTPLGNLPEVGMALVPGREGEAGKIMKDSGRKDAAGKPISVEIQVVADDAKPQAKSDTSIRITTPKPGGDLAKSLETLHAKGEAKKDAVGKTKGAGKGATITVKGDHPMSAPVVPAFARVDVGTIVAKLLGHTKHYAGQVVEDARKGWAGGKMKRGDVDKFIDPEVPPVSAELHKIATAAGVSEDALNAKTKAEEAKLVKDVDTQNKEAEGQHIKTGVEIKRERSFLANRIEDLRDGLDYLITDKEEMSKGGFEREKVEAQRKAAKDDIDKLVVKWRGEYKRMGEARAGQIKEAGQKQNDAYVAAAEIDRRQIDITLGITDPAKRKEEVAKARAAQVNAWDNKYQKSDYEKTDNWLAQTLKELGVNISDLSKAATDIADGYKTDITSAGEQADKIVDDWAEARFNKERSWWNRLIQAIVDWLSPAKKQAKDWETASTENNNANLSKDMIWLEQARIKHWNELSDDTIKSSGAFTEEQQAMLMAMKAGGDSATALAAGLISRISQQQRESLQKQFEAEVMTWMNPAAVEEIGIGQGGQSAGFANAKAKAIYIAGVDQVGTNEKGIFDALTGLTKIQGRAVELKYTELYPGRSMRDDLKSELYDWTQQLTGSTGDWDRSEALLEGNADKATAIELDQAMNETFGGLGWGTDTTAIFRLLKDKSPAQIAAIKAEYRRRYNKDLVTELDKELDDGFSTQHDVNRMYALMAGDKEKARAIEADSKMRGSIFFGLGTDKKGLEQVYTDINAEVEAEGERKGWDTDRVQREIAKRYDVLDKKYETQYGADFEKREGKDSALRTAMKESFTWGTGKAAYNFTTSTGDLDLLLSYQNVGQHKDDKDIKKVFDTQLAESNAARIQSEHRGIFSSSDKEIDKALAAQYETAYKDELRDRKLELERTKDFEWGQLQDKLAAEYKDRRAAAEKLTDPAARDAALKKIAEEKKEKERDFKHKWAPQGADYASMMRDLKKTASASAQLTAGENMKRLASTFDAKYQQWNYDNGVGFGGMPVHARQSFDSVVKGDTGWGIFSGARTAENDKTIALLEGHGYLSQDDKLYFAIKGLGTDEDTAKEVFADADSVESKEILARLGHRLAVEDKDKGELSDDAAAAKAKAWVMDDFSGREGQDQEIAMMGVPRTPDEYLAIAKRRKEMEQASGPSKYASALPMLAPFGAALLMTPAAPLGGALLGASQLGGALSSIDKESLGLLDDQIRDLEEQKRLADELTKKGRMPGDEDYDKVMDQIAVLNTRVQNAVELHRAQVDAATDVVTNIVTAVVMIVVTVVSIIAAPVSGGASAAAAFALWSAVIGSVAATVANIGVKMAMKGDAYGIEEIGYDAAVGLAEAIASGLTAGLGDKFLKMGFLAKMAEGGVLSRIAAHGLANAAEGILQALPGALVGNVLNDENYKNGDPFTNVLFGTVAQVGMAGAMSGTMGGLIGGIKKPTHLITPGTAEYTELFHQYQVKNPGATHEQFRLDLHMKVLTGEHPALGKKQLESVAREQVLAGLDKELDKDAVKQFKKLKVEVVSPEEFTRITKSKELGEAAVMMRRGEPTILVKAGADLENLHREAPHLLQAMREDSAKLMAKLDESALAHWDKLPIERQVDLYKTKIKLEIEAHEHMLARLTPEQGIKRFGKEGFAKELEYTQQTLANLENRLKDVEKLDLEAIRNGKVKPHYLEEPPRLFTKRTETPAKPRLGAEEHPNTVFEHPSHRRFSPEDEANIKRRYDIVGDPMDPHTPRLAVKGGREGEPSKMLVAYTEGGQQKFKMREVGEYRQPPEGHIWFDDGTGELALRRISKPTQPVDQLRWDAGAGDFVPAEGKDWATRRSNLIKSSKKEKFATFDFSKDGPLASLSKLSKDDKLLVSRWAGVLDVVDSRMSKAEREALFKDITGYFEGKPMVVTEAISDKIRARVRRQIGDVVGRQEDSVRRTLIDAALGEALRRGESDKGHLFRDVVRGHLQGAGAMEHLPDIGMKQPIPSHPGRASAKRDFDDAFTVKKSLGENGPKRGNFFGEYKAGPKAFDLDQSLDYAVRFRERSFTPPKTKTEMAGVCVIFDKAEHADAAFRRLRDAPGARGAAFREAFEGKRFYVGYYDEAGKLKFAKSLDEDIVKRARKPITPHEGGAGFVPGSHDLRGVHPNEVAHQRATIDRASTALRGMEGVEPVNRLRYRIDVPNGEPIEIRVIPRSMGDNPVADVARYQYYPHTRSASVFVSDQASATSIDRAMAHEVAELRHKVSGRAGKVDLLAHGSVVHSGARLSAHDAGRVAEIEWLARRISTATDDETRRAARGELHALVDELGLRRGVKQAEARLALCERRLSPEAAGMLRDVRGGMRSLDAADRELLAATRARAQVDRGVVAARAAQRDPLRSPVDLGHTGVPNSRELRASADAAKAARNAKSEQTYRTLAAAGASVSIDSPMIGGGAALAGLRSDQMLVDPAGRWHLDRSKRIAQTADQLHGVRTAGFAEPLSVARPGTRVPVDAIRAWQDMRAAEGQVLNATGKLELVAGGGIVTKVRMADGRELALPTTGIPVIAAGFPHEATPGAARLRPGAALHEIQAANLQTAAADARWADLRRDFHGRVFTGDEANVLSFDPKSSNKWIIAGTGGTAISAAEIILRSNPEAEVRMVGGRWTRGIKSNPQYQGIMNDPSLSSRFSARTNVRINEVRAVHVGADVHFEIAPGEQGRSVIVALAGRNRVPEPIAEAVAKVQNAGGAVHGEALRDVDGHYLGYRLHFPEGQKVDVTGAASRFPPNDVHFTTEDRRFMNRAGRQDAPAESGNFSGGFGPSAEQAYRYSLARRRGDI